MEIRKTATSPRTLRRFRRVLRRRLVLATGVSSLGDGLAVVAFPLLALRVTSNPLLISGLAFAARLPWLLMALPAGAIVDRVNRRRLVFAVDTIRGLTVAGVAAGVLVGWLSIEALYAAAFLVGAGETVVSTAVRAELPLLSGGNDLHDLNGQLFAAQTAGLQFAGPALGGVVFSLSAAVPFLGDAASYAVSAGVLGTTMSRGDAAAAPPSDRLRHEIRTGLRWFLANPALRILAAVVTSFAFCQAMVLAVLVLYATRVLGLSDVGYGIFLAIAAVGDVGASLLAGRIHARLGAWATVVAAGIGAAAGYLLLGSTSVVVVAVAALALEAFATSLGNVTTVSARQEIIPPEHFGLVNNAFRMSVTGCVPIGALLGGALTAAVGLHVTFLLAGALQLVVLAGAAAPLRALGSATGRRSAVTGSADPTGSPDPAPPSPPQRAASTPGGAHRQRSPEGRRQGGSRA